MKRDVVDKFKELLGDDCVFTESKELNLYSTNTIAFERRIKGVICATSSDQIPAILRLAKEFSVNLYPISTGKNWGYGSASPVSNDCFILDLSKLNRIIEFNAELGYVVVEPGVTQKDLFNFIECNRLDFMVPTTGAGPNVSLLGNALEKGYGITPVEDHSLSLLQVHAYLPDGSLYKSQLHEFGGYRSDTVFKWKIGPYLDSLFQQSNLGIVFQVTIALAKKPNNVTQFISFIAEDNLEEAVACIREVRRQLGSISGGINLMNRRRILSMVGDNEWPMSSAANEMAVRRMAKKQNLTDWVVLGGLYGTDSLVEAAKKVVSDRFNTITNRTLFFGPQRLKIAKKIVEILPIKSLKKNIGGLENAMRILQGEPMNVALRLAYLKNQNKFDDPEHNLSPDRDQCGLIWFSPLLPIDGHLVRDFTTEVHRICLFYDIDPLITLTSISERCFDSTIPILFDKTNTDHVRRAESCLKSLIKMSQDLGIFPYRLDIRSMQEFYPKYQGAASLLWENLKNMSDPDRILAPGRYEPLRPGIVK